MHLTRTLTMTAVITLMAGAAYAQAPVTTIKAPPAAATPSATVAGATAGPSAGARVVAAGDIVATAKASGQFNTFLKAAEATNLTVLLKDTQNLTVFVPTDAAFAALPAGELAKLMLPENKAQLQKLLIYHVINAKVPSSEFKGATRKAATVAGHTVELSGGAALKVNDAGIVQADIMASNGVMHVVDKVLTPPGAMAAVNSAMPASATAPAAKEPTTLPATQVLPKQK